MLCRRSLILIRTEAQISAPQSFNPKEATHLPPLHLRRPEFRKCLTSRMKIAILCHSRNSAHFSRVSVHLLRAFVPSFSPHGTTVVFVHTFMDDICADSTSQRSTRQGEMERIPRVREREGTRRQSLEWYDTKVSTGKAASIPASIILPNTSTISSSFSKQFPSYSRLLVSQPAYYHV